MTPVFVLRIIVDKKNIVRKEQKKMSFLKKKWLWKNTLKDFSQINYVLVYCLGLSCVCVEISRILFPTIFKNSNQIKLHNKSLNSISSSSKIHIFRFHKVAMPRILIAEWELHVQLDFITRFKMGL